MKLRSNWLSSLLLCAAVTALLLLGGSGCATSPKHVFPVVNWEHDKAGLSPKIIREVDAFVHTLDTTGLMVVKDGKVVYEYGNVAEPSYLASARKSVLSMLYGPYVAKGTIRLGRTLKDLGMSDVGGLLPTEESATVLDLITARSGVYHPASNDGDLLEFAPKRGSQEPGSYWLYSNWDFNAAGAAFERMTGKNIYDALRDNLAIPIGMQDFDREQQKKDEKPERSQYPSYPMWLSTRDMARLGYLMLRQGQWQDRQLIPAKWVRRSTSVVTPLPEMHPETLQSGPFGFGYMWWVWDGLFASGPYQGAYTASGAHGQWISVLPVLDMVVVHVASWSSTGPRHSVDKPDYYRLLDLITGKHPASEAELRQWKEAANARVTPGKEVHVTKEGMTLNIQIPGQTYAIYQVVK
jgi:CubicO group peptidase (beta-lactamase class C family)